VKPKLKSLLKKKDIPEFKKIVTKVSFIVLLLALSQLLLTFIGTIFHLDEFKEFFGSCYLIYSVFVIMFVYKMDKDYVFDNRLQVQPMKPSTFFKCFSSMMALMLIFVVPTVILDTILNNYGYTILNIASANRHSDTITEFLYVAFLGPICEEVLFRGMIQKQLYKFTPFIAIFTSSVMFGIYHGNFGQMFQAIGVGIILGYVAYRYSIKWSIAMHITYNLCMGELFGWLTNLLEKDGQEFLLPVIDLPLFDFTVSVLAAIGFIFVFIQFFFKKNFLYKYNVKFSKFIIPFTSVGFICFTVFNLITSVLLIAPV
jgi:membrane protease YdiL (CAAX protease family)